MSDSGHVRTPADLTPPGVEGGDVFTTPRPPGLGSCATSGFAMTGRHRL